MFLQQACGLVKTLEIPLDDSKNRQNQEEGGLLDLAYSDKMRTQIKKKVKIHVEIMLQGILQKSCPIFLRKFVTNTSWSASQFSSDILFGIFPCYFYLCVFFFS